MLKIIHLTFIGYAYALNSAIKNHDLVHVSQSLNYGRLLTWKMHSFFSPFTLEPRYGYLERISRASR